MSVAYLKIVRLPVYARLLDRHRPGHSTTHGLLEFIRSVLFNVEKRKPALSVFCDVSKALNLVDCEFLYTKLECYGISLIGGWKVSLIWFSL